MSGPRLVSGQARRGQPGDLIGDVRSLSNVCTSKPISRQLSHCTLAVYAPEGPNHASVSSLLGAQGAYM